MYESSCVYKSDNEQMYEKQPEDAYKSPEECLGKSCIYTEEEGDCRTVHTTAPAVSGSHG